MAHRILSSFKFTGSPKKAEPVTIVAFQSGYPKIDKDALAAILEDVDNLPLIIVSMIGVARVGKSFLLNLYMNYLNHLEKNGDDKKWEFSKEKTEGFPWGKSEEAVTLGISVWSKPFIIKPRKGEKIAVLLMDCEGEGHLSGDSRVDNLVTFISLQIASVQLINVDKLIHPIDLTRLKLCLDNAEISQDDESLADDSLFRSLVFVTKNYNQGPCGEDNKVFDKLLKSPNQDLTTLIKGIKNTFKPIVQFKFPFPGEIINDATQDTYDWDLSGIKRTFLSTAKSLFRRISFMDDQRESQHCWETAAEAAYVFETIKDRFEDKDLPEVLTNRDLLDDSICRRIYSDVSKSCEVMLFQFSGKEKLERFLKLEDLEKAIKIEADVFRIRFQSEVEIHGMKNPKYYSKYQLELERTIGNLHLMAVVEQKKMRLRKLQEELKAANKKALEQLLLGQKATIERWIKNLEESVDTAMSKDRRSVEELQKKLKEAANWRARERIEKQLKEAEGRLEKIRSNCDEDVRRLRDYKETVEINIKIVKGDVTVYTKQVKEEIECLTPEIKEMALQLKERLESQSSLKIKHFFINAGLVLGAVVASPLILIAAAAAGLLVLGDTVINKIKRK